MVQRRGKIHSSGEKMGVKVKTTKDEFPEMQRTANVLAGKKVKVGVFGGEHEWLASIHEYGCKIPVTPEMRAYLHNIGIHLRKSTTVITIPERSFIRAGHDECAGQVLDAAEKVLFEFRHIITHKNESDTHKYRNQRYHIEGIIKQ